MTSFETPSDPMHSIKPKRADVSTTVKLRMISYQNEAGGKYTSFVGMTDQEFEQFRGMNHKGFGQFQDRIVHTVNGDKPSEEDIRDAKSAFSHRFGSNNAPDCGL